MIAEPEVVTSDGRTLHVYDAGGPDGSLVVVWHHGTPNVGEPPGPLLPAAAARGLRFVSYDRPGYGTSTAHPGRDVAAAASDVAAVADELGIARFALVGHSGGAPHALACAALLPGRALAVASISATAPFGADGLDWFAGMADPATCRAALQGRAGLEAYFASSHEGPDPFTHEDNEALAGRWSWLADVAGRAWVGGTAGMVDDELAYVAPWGFDPGLVAVPVLIVHGRQDRIVPASHGRWLASRVPSAEMWLRPEDGHITVLDSGVAVLDWLLAHAAAG
jgi:pimeloyl-ACP methyl ester carboxylesterase